MMFLRLCKQSDGATAVEFGLLAPLFFAALFGVINCGMLLWTQLGLQHATETAARCASVNAGICNSTAAIQSYAAHAALGLNIPPSTFTVTTPGCGTQVTASYDFAIIARFFGTPSITLSARACFPK